MSNKKHAKILFCRFKYPVVVELGEWKADYLTIGRSVVKTLNDAIANNAGLEDEFWFLNAIVKGKSSIVTASSQHDYPVNDPRILAKLESYLNNEPTQDAIQPIPKELPLGEPNIVKRNTPNEKTAQLLANKLTKKIGHQAEVATGVEGRGYYVLITSFTLSKIEIFKVLNAINSQSG